MLLNNVLYRLSNHKMICCGHGAFILLTLSCLIVVESLSPIKFASKLPSEVHDFNDGDSNDSDKTSRPGKRWAVLVAGSRGFDNYRHQVYIWEKKIVYTSF